MSGFKRNLCVQYPTLRVSQRYELQWTSFCLVEIFVRLAGGAHLAEDCIWYLSCLYVFHVPFGYGALQRTVTDVELQQSSGLHFFLSAWFVISRNVRRRQWDFRCPLRTAWNGNWYIHVCFLPKQVMEGVAFAMRSSRDALNDGQSVDNGTCIFVAL